MNWIDRAEIQILYRAGLVENITSLCATSAYHTGNELIRKAVQTAAQRYIDSLNGLEPKKGD